MRGMNRSYLLVAVALMALLSGILYIGVVSGEGVPVTEVPGAGTAFPNPSPVFETPTATPTPEVVTESTEEPIGIVEVKELPSTGAGTTAKDFNLNACCMWHGSSHYETEYLCHNGHNDKIVWYVIGWDYYLYQRIHYVSWSCNANYG